MDRRDFIKSLAVVMLSKAITDKLIANDTTEKLNLDNLNDDDLERFLNKLDNNVLKTIPEKLAEEWWNDMMEAEKEFFTKCQS